MTFAIFESLTRAEPTTRAVPGAVRAATEGSAAGLSQWLVQSLDEIDYGMLMLDERGNVLYVNEAARSDLDRQHPLQLLG